MRLTLLIVPENDFDRRSCHRRLVSMHAIANEVGILEDRVGRDDLAVQSYSAFLNGILLCEDGFSSAYEGQTDVVGRGTVAKVDLKNVEDGPAVSGTDQC
jgi:hypothetical protein